MSFTDRLWFRVRALVGRPQLDAEIDAELRDHVQRQTQANIAAGMAPEPARRAALAAFGGVQQHKEAARDARGMRWLDDLGQDLRYAFRSLRRTPGFSLVAVATLALGVGANTAMFTVVRGVLLRPLALPEPERLVVADFSRLTGRRAPWPAMYDGQYLAFASRTRSYDALAGMNPTTVALTNAGEPALLRAALVTPGFFAVVAVQPGIGRGFASNEGQPGRPPVAVISDGLWRSRFNADSAIVGRDIVIEGAPRTVVGVMPADFDFPYQASLWLPAEIRIDPRNANSHIVAARLKPGVPLRQAGDEFASLARVDSNFAPDPGETEHPVARILPATELETAGVQQSLVVFSAAVALVLLIACANVANLMLMRGTARRREIAVRATLGASRPRLVRQLLTESCALSLIGTGMGLALATGGVRALLRLAPAGAIPRSGDIHVDGLVLSVAVAIALISGIGFGIAPALQAAHDMLGASRDAARVTGSGSRLRHALVVAEVALSLMLVTGAGLMVRSFVALRAVDVGFRPEQVVAATVDLPVARYASPARIHEFRERAIEAIQRIPEVTSAGAVNWRPMAQAMIQGSFRAEGIDGPPGFNVVKPGVTPGYFAAIGLPLLEGRDFTSTDAGGAPAVAIVSKGMATRLWPNQNAIGKRLSMQDKPGPGDWITVVGVVGDIRQRTLAAPAPPTMYGPLAQTPQSFFLRHLSFTVRSAADPSRVKRSLAAAIRSADPDLPIQSLTTMVDEISAQRAGPLFQTRLLVTFSLLALGLAAIGVYGVLAYSITERTREIGVRMALGAARTAVMGMVVRRALLLGGIGVVIGAGGAWATTRVLTRFLYGVSPTDPVTFAATAGLLMLVAIAAGLVPARRASRVDPMVALRAE